MSMYYEGIGQTVATFAAGSGVKEGMVCKLSANGAVAVCSAADPFHGMALHVDQAGAAVVLRGLVTVSYTGTTAPSVGLNTLTADGAGGVTVAQSGQSILAVHVDTTAKTVTILL